MTMDELVQTENWKKFMNKMDLFGIILLVISIILIVAGFKFERFVQIYITTLSLLSIIGFFIGFSKFNSESKVLSFVFYRIYGYGLALGFATLMLVLLSFELPLKTMIIISIIMLSTSLILGLRERMSENTNNIDWKFFLRIFIALLAIFYVMTLNK